MAKSHVVVDGSNIATEGRTAPSLTQLEDAVDAFLAEFPHEIVTVVVDATFPNRIAEGERKRYEKKLEDGELLTPPAGAIGRGDAFILMIADKAGADVFSNDSFQEFHGEHPWLFDEGRLIGAKPVEHVGWVFVKRAPVRGPKSRRSVRDAKRSDSRSSSSRSSGGRGSADRGRRAESGAKKAPAKKTPAKRSTAGRAAPAKKTAAKKTTKRTTAKKASTRTRKITRKAASGETIEKVIGPDTGTSDESGRQRRRRSRGPVNADPFNEPFPFIEFVGAHPVGTTVEAEVVEFSSHGAYAQAGNVRCYIPLKSMGDPAPRSAREVLSLGDTVTFVVFGFDAPRRGVDLAMTSQSSLAANGEENPSEDARESDEEALASTARTRPLTRSSSTVATKKTTKKAPAKKTAAKKRTPAKKTAAKKAPAKKKAAAKKTVKRAPAKKAPAKKTAAKKAPAKKAPAKKTAAKKAPAKKAPAKKTAAKKAPAKKAPAKKTAAKKAPAKKAPAKKR
ncbi:MAG: S1 RNA-binding domain-containing protein [Actinomycetia bacterium]|nr:S1 RNA-binding domain-containing protein [Actinomycetes bacterium]